MSTNNLVPFTAGAKPAAAFAAALNSAEPESLADGIGSSYGIISYKGKVWSLRFRGEKKVFVRPDDNTPVGHIDVIILRQARIKSKSYYETYDPNAEAGRPICASLDGVVPDADVTSKQSDTCALCPRNVWKTGPNGKKSRECTDYKRLAVLLLPGQTQRLLGAPLMEPVFLRVPPASLQPLGAYGEQLNNQGFHYSAVATRISFDPNEATPKMIFQAIQALTDAEAPVVLPMREDPQALRITGEDQTPAIGHTSPLAVTSQPQQAPQQPAQTVASPKQDTVHSAPLDTGLGLATSITAAQRVETLLTTKSPSEGGLLELQANKSAAADTGAAEDSDADLDAKIKSLLST